MMIWLMYSGVSAPSDGWLPVTALCTRRWNWPTSGAGAKREVGDSVGLEGGKAWHVNMTSWESTKLRLTTAHLPKDNESNRFWIILNRIALLQAKIISITPFSYVSLGDTMLPTRSTLGHPKQWTSLLQRQPTLPCKQVELSDMICHNLTSFIYSCPRLYLWS